MAESKCNYYKRGKCHCGHCKWLGIRVPGNLNYPPCKDCENFTPAKRYKDETRT